MIGQSSPPHSGQLLPFDRAILGALIDSVLRFYWGLFVFFGFFGDKNA